MKFLEKVYIREFPTWPQPIIPTHLVFIVIMFYICINKSIYVILSIKYCEYFKHILYLYYIKYFNKKINF